MTRHALLVLGTLALTLGTVACDENGANPNFGAYLVEAGECEGNGYGKDMDTAEPEPTEIWAEADGRDVILHLDNLQANCCPSADAVITLDGADILVEFDDVTTGDPCDCECIIDFVITIEDLDAGTFTIEVDYNGTSLGSTDVEVS